MTTWLHTTSTRSNMWEHSKKFLTSIMMIRDMQRCFDIHHSFWISVRRRRSRNWETNGIETLTFRNWCRPSWIFRIRRINDMLWTTSRISASKLRAASRKLCTTWLSFSTPKSTTGWIIRITSWLSSSKTKNTTTRSVDPFISRGTTPWISANRTNRSCYRS